MHIFFESHRQTFITAPVVLQSFSILFYMAFGTISFVLLRKTRSLALHWAFYITLQLAEIWILMLIEIDQPFKFACLQLIFNVGFVYIYILFANEIHVVLFNSINFVSFIIFSVVLYYCMEMATPPPLISPFSVMVSVFFFTLWLTMFLYNNDSFDDMMYLKFPFRIFDQLAQIFQQNIF